MKKGMNGFGIPADMATEDLFRGLKETGFDGVEFCLNEKMSDERIAEINRYSEKYGVAVLSLVPFKLWDLHLTSEDEGIRKQAMETVKETILTAKALKADAILVVPGVVTPDVSYAKAIENCHKSLKELLPFIEENKVCVCLENVWNKFLTSAYDMRDFIDSIGSEYVQAYFDAGNVLVNGYPEYWIEILGKRIKRLHIKDFKCSVGNLDGFVDLFDGDMDWSRLMKALRAVGYDGYVTVEVPGDDKNPLRFFDATSKKLDRIFSM